MTEPRPSLLAVAGVVGAWLGLKLVSVYAWVTQVNAFGDTDYYAWATRNAAQDGSMARWLSEYPTPAAWFLQLPLLLGDQSDASYRATFLVLISLVDLAFLGLVLARLGVAPALAWAILTTLCGQVAVLRMDLLPAVLAAAGLLLALRGRTSASAVLIALGTAAKVWPILLFPLALGRRGARPRALGAFVASGVALVVVSVLGAGWHRLLSPLNYQADRGLQVESVAATIPMVNALARPGYKVYYSSFKAFEVTGPGVAEMIQVANVAAIASIVLVAGLLVWWWLRGCPGEATGYLGLLVVCLFIATSKAYSPQYTLWIAALATVLFGVSRVDPAEFEPVRASAVLGITTVIAVLTTAIYPTYYGDVVAPTQRGVTLLILRNGLLLVLIALVVALIVERLRRSQRS